LANNRENPVGFRSYLDFATCNHPAGGEGIVSEIPHRIIFSTASSTWPSNTAETSAV
jgi:hypothetical protein